MKFNNRTPLLISFSVFVIMLVLLPMTIVSSNSGSDVQAVHGVYLPMAQIAQILPTPTPTPFVSEFSIPDKPPTTRSIYVRYANTELLDEWGCEAGEISRPETVSVVHLFFGSPYFEESTDGSVIYGTRLFPVDSEYEFVTMPEITEMLVHFALGYIRCADERSILHLGAGTSNSDFRSWDPIQHVSPEHGEKWAELVLNSFDEVWDITTGRVLVVGTSDMEPGFNTSSVTIDWVDAYFDYASEQGRDILLYNAGTANGCPSRLAPTHTCGTRAFPNWTREQIWYISSSHTILKFPQIYDDLRASHWHYVLLYGVEAHGILSSISGVLSTYDACSQDPTDDACFSGYSSQDSWDSMARNLLSDPVTDKTVFYMDYASDVWWQPTPTPVQ